MVINTKGSSMSLLLLASAATFLLLIAPSAVSMMQEHRATQARRAEALERFATGLSA